MNGRVDRRHGRDYPTQGINVKRGVAFGEFILFVDEEAAGVVAVDVIVGYLVS